MRRGAAASLLSLAFLLAPPAFAQPGGVSVAPVRVDLGPGRRSASVTVHNGSDVPYRFQAELLRWTQTRDGEDTYAPSDELLANPLLFELKPGAAQIVRVGLLGAPPDSIQHAYRLYLTEIPRQEPATGTGLRVLLRLGVPVLVAPQQPLRRNLAWSARVSETGLALTAENRGSAVERRAQLRVSDADRNAALFSTDGFRDILPGAQVQWQLPLAAPAPQRLLLETNTHDGRETTTVPVDRR